LIQIDNENIKNSDIKLKTQLEECTETIKMNESKLFQNEKEIRAKSTCINDLNKNIFSNTQELNGLNNRLETQSIRQQEIEEIMYKLELENRKLKLFSKEKETDSNLISNKLKNQLEFLNQEIKSYETEIQKLKNSIVNLESFKMQIEESINSKDDSIAKKERTIID